MLLARRIFALTALGLAALASPRTPTQPVEAQDPIPAQMKVAGRFAAAGPSRAVAVQGEVAYLGIGHQLDVLDIADPARPRMIATFSTARTVGAVAVAGALGYVVEDGGQVTVLDLTTPADPRPLGTAQIQGAEDPGGMVLSGQQLLLAGRNAGLVVIDVADPAAPRRIGSLGMTGAALDVAVSSAGRVLVAAGAGGLVVADLADPTQPREIGRWVPDGEVGAVAAAGETVFVGMTETYQFPAAGRLDADRPPRLVRVHMVVLDLTDPAHPREIAKSRVGTDTTDDLIGLTVSDGRAYVLGSDYVPLDALGHMTVFDVTDPQQPRALAQRVSPELGADVVAVRGLALIAELPGGLEIIDTTLPGAPRVAEYHRPGSVMAMAAAGKTVWVLDDHWAEPFRITRHLVGVDVRDPGHARQISLSPAEAFSDSVVREATAIAARGSRVYLAGEKSGFVVFDAADPAAPRPVGAIALNPRVGGMALDGEFAYVVSGMGGSMTQGLNVIDVSDAAAPRVMGFAGPFLHATEVAVAGGRAYVSNRTLLNVVDVSDPTRPAASGAIAYGESEMPIQVAARGRYAYVLHSDATLRVVDGADHARPREVARVPVGDPGPVGVFVTGRILYAVTAYAVHVFDVTVPERPTEFATWRGGPNNFPGILKAALDPDHVLALSLSQDAGIILLHPVEPLPIWQLFVPYLEQPRE